MIRNCLIKNLSLSPSLSLSLISQDEYLQSVYFHSLMKLWQKKNKKTKNKNGSLWLSVKPALTFDNLTLICKRHNEHAVYWTGTDSLSFLQNCHASVWKVVFLTRKPTAPLGTNFFPCKVNNFSEGALIAGKQTRSQLRCLLYNKWRKFYKVYPVPLTLALLNKLRCHSHF